MVLLTPAGVDESARMPGGLLSRSLPAPTGWSRGGLSIKLRGCGEPVLRDKCVDATDVPNRRGDVGNFPAIPIEQGVTCSTTGPDGINAEALDRYTATADWSLGRQLQTDAIGFGSPKLDDATIIGTVPGSDFVEAVACLEQDAADNGFGSKFVLHAPVRAAAYLADHNLIDGNGKSPTGADWIISSGYRVHPTTPATIIRLYATGLVWASIEPAEVFEAVGYATNDVDAWARGVGIVAFNPCILTAIDITVSACGA